MAEVEKLKDAETGAVYTWRRLFVRSGRQADQARVKRDPPWAPLKAELDRLPGLVNPSHYTTGAAVQDRAGQLLGKTPAGRFIQIQVTRTRAKSAPMRLTWSVPCKPLEEAAQWDGVYSILTPLPATTHSANEGLTIYKGQPHVESRFRNRNQLPIRVRPLWLKRPDRIETLIFWVMLAVLIYALIEGPVHRHIAQTGPKIVGVRPEKRDTFTPSGLRLLGACAGGCLVRGNDGQRLRVQVSDLSAVQRQILTAIGLSDLPARVTNLPQQARAMDVRAPA